VWGQKHKRREREERVQVVCAREEAHKKEVTKNNKHLVWVCKVE